MDFESIELSELSRTEKRQILYTIIYMWNLKHITSVIIKRWFTHRLREQASSYHVEGEGNTGVKFANTGHTNFCVKRHKDGLHNTEIIVNIIQ